MIRTLLALFFFSCNPAFANLSYPPPNIPGALAPGGSASQCLTWVSATSMAWAACSGGGGGTPGGSNKQLQYNNSGAFGGMTNYEFDGTSFDVKGTSNIVFGSGTTSSINDNGAGRLQLNSSIAVDVTGPGITTNLVASGAISNGAGNISLSPSNGSAVVITGGRFLELDGATSGNVKLFSPATTTSYSLSFPSAAPASNGQSITCTTAGVCSFTTIASGSPGGPNTAIQYNNSGSFGGTAAGNGNNFTYNGSATVELSQNGSLGVGFPILRVGDSGGAGNYLQLQGRQNLISAYTGFVGLISTQGNGSNDTVIGSGDSNAATTNSLHFTTGAVTANNGALTSGATTFETGNGTGATNSGNMTFTPGTSGSGTRGRIRMGYHVISIGTAPTVTANCGTSPSVVGTDTAGRITVGSGGTAVNCTITFASAWTTNAPACVVSDETGALLLKVTPSTTTLSVTSATPFGAGDTLGYSCIGFE